MDSTLIISLDGTLEEIKLPLDSINIAPYGIHTGGRKWRKELKIGSAIDYMNNTGTWRQYTITDYDSKNLPIISIDSHKESIYSIRIQRPNTIAKIGEGKVEENDIGDTSDVLLNSTEGVECYGILRSDKVKSLPIVQLVNIFGEQGGFECMLKRIKETKVSLGNLKYNV